MYGDIVEGELRLTWSKDNLEEVALAEKTFREHIIKGWLAFGETSGEKKQIFTFNPNLEKIVLAPIVEGG